MVKGLILIPAYNESGALPGVIKKVRTKMPQWDLLVVDDSSTDDTRQILQENNVPHLHLPVNLGIGGAMHAGFTWAFRHGYEKVVQTDGDGQHPIDAIETLAGIMDEKEVDMVIGSRFIVKTDYKPGWARWLGIRLFSGVIHATTGVCIADPTSGFRMINRKVLELFVNDYPSDYPEPDSLVQALLVGCSVVEVPVNMNYRNYGRSSINIPESIYYMIKVPFAMFLKYRMLRGRGR